MIETKLFQPTPKELFFANFKKTIINIFIGYLIGIAFVFIMNRDSALFSYPEILYFCLFLAVLMILGLFLRYRGLKSAKFQRLFLKRQIVFDDNGLKISIEDDSTAIFPWANVGKVIKKRACYLLYTSQIQFQYLPFYAFQKEADQQAFEALLQKKNLL